MLASAVLWAGSSGPISRAIAGPEAAGTLGPDQPREAEHRAHEPHHDHLDQAGERGCAVSWGCANDLVAVPL